jgi:RluA family pseudouridine synthase
VAQARKLTASGRDRGRPLADFLAERLGLDRAGAAALVRAGGVYVGRARVEEPGRALDAGERVTVHEPAGPDAEVADSVSSAALAADVHAIAVVHADPEVLVVDKPAGMPSQATRETTAGALDRLVARDEPGARLLHRLDRDASGLVLFTRNPAAHRRFAALLREGGLERSYAAVAWGHVGAGAGRLDRPIGPDPRDRRRMAAGQGRSALTLYRAVRRGRTSTGAPTTLLELDLATGRTHQIRVHLSGAGHPLCGDRLYGPAAPPAPVARLCLHACRLAWPGAAPVVSAAPACFDALCA